jgi:hypothetical protein
MVLLTIAMVLPTTVEAQGIDIEKTTDSVDNQNPTSPDFDNEDDPNGPGVPVIPAGSDVVWTYKVTNTGLATIPLADITVTDSVAGVNPTLVIDANSTDGLLSPGEMWFYTATGTSVDLTDPAQTVGLTIVTACNPNQIPGGDLNTYVNNGMVTIPGDSDSDPSHYCNPKPAIDIEKTTDAATNSNPTDSDFDNEDDPNGVGVPIVDLGEGLATIPLADITVTDSVAGVNPTLVIDANSTDGLLSPGEMWFYTATGTSVDLTNPAQTVGLTIVPGCNPNNIPGGDRNTYMNMGTVTVPGDSDSDPSHYCNEG